MTLVEKAGERQITNVDHETREVKNLTKNEEGNQIKEQEHEDQQLIVESEEEVFNDKKVDHRKKGAGVTLVEKAGKTQITNVDHETREVTKKVRVETN